MIKIAIFKFNKNKSMILFWLLLMGHLFTSRRTPVFYRTRFGKQCHEGMLGSGTGWRQWVASLMSSLLYWRGKSPGAHWTADSPCMQYEHYVIGHNHLTQLTSL